MIYELWETETGNLVGTYETEQDALGLVRDTIQCYGAQYVDSLLLGCEDEKGYSTFIAEGQALAERALAEKATSGGPA